MPCFHFSLYIQKKAVYSLPKRTKKAAFFPKADRFGTEAHQRLVNQSVLTACLFQGTMHFPFHGLWYTATAPQLRFSLSLIASSSSSGFCRCQSRRASHTSMDGDRVSPDPTGALMRQRAQQLLAANLGPERFRLNHACPRASRPRTTAG